MNLCGPASFLVCWANRDPLAFANWATTLFENGSASIGTLDIAPRADLVAQNYAQMVRGRRTPAGDRNRSRKSAAIRPTSVGSQRYRLTRPR